VPGTPSQTQTQTPSDYPLIDQSGQRIDQNPIITSPTPKYNGSSSSTNGDFERYSHIEGPASVTRSHHQGESANGSLDNNTHGHSNGNGYINGNNGHINGDHGDRYTEDASSGSSNGYHGQDNGSNGTSKLFDTSESNASQKPTQISNRESQDLRQGANGEKYGSAPHMNLSATSVEMRKGKKGSEPRILFDGKTNSPQRPDPIKVCVYQYRFVYVHHILALV
jgi:hypothetical protein